MASGDSGSGTSDGNAAQCESFRDQSPPPDLRTISIVNSGNVPVYVLPDFRYCPAVSSLVRVERDGQAVNVLPLALDCERSCQLGLDRGWNVAFQRACASDCAVPPVVMIQPGQTLQQPVNLEVVQRDLPQTCVAGAPDPAASVQCFSQVIPPAGNYTLSLHVTNLDCAQDTDCDCHPDATGACTNYDVLRYGVSGSTKVLTFPTSSYFQNQELRISAPFD